MELKRSSPTNHMTPGTLTEKLVIYGATADGMTLTFKDDAGEVLALPDIGYTCQVRTHSGGDLLVNISVDASGFGTGILELTWDASATATLKTARTATWGLLDSDGTLWIEDVCHIKTKTPK